MKSVKFRISRDTLLHTEPHIMYKGDWVDTHCVKILIMPIRHLRSAHGEDDARIGYFICSKLCREVWWWMRPLTVLYDEIKLHHEPTRT